MHPRIYLYVSTTYGSTTDVRTTYVSTTYGSTTYVSTTNCVGIYILIAQNKRKGKPLKLNSCASSVEFWFQGFRLTFLVPGFLPYLFGSRVFALPF